MAVIRSNPQRTASRRRQARPTPHDQWVAELDARKKERTEPRPSRRLLTDEQYEAVVAHRDETVQRVIKNGHRKPRTWDEINSTKGGGRDFKR